MTDLMLASGILYRIIIPTKYQNSQFSACKYNKNSVPERVVELPLQTTLAMRPFLLNSKEGKFHNYNRIAIPLISRACGYQCETSRSSNRISFNGAPVRSTTQTRLPTLQTDCVAPWMIQPRGGVQPRMPVNIAS